MMRRLPSLGRVAHSHLSMTVAPTAICIAILPMGSKRPRCEAISVDAHARTIPHHSTALATSPRSITRQCAMVARAVKKRVILAIRCLLRLLRHALVLGPTACAAPVALASAVRDPATGELHIPEWWWRMLCSAVEFSGPCLLKFAQWGAARRDLFPEAFCRHAGRLQDRTHAHGGSWLHARNALNESLGPMRALSYGSSDGDDAPFAVGWQWPASVDGSAAGSSRSSHRHHGSSIQSNLHDVSATAAWELELEGPDGTPPRNLGAGCVASVYRGRVRRITGAVRNDEANGIAPAFGAAALEVYDYGGSEEVAVKVVHPRVAAYVELDLTLLAAAAAMLEALPGLGLKWLGPSEAVDQFRAVMQNQLNLRTEAHALRRFRSNFRHDKRVTFPEPLLASEGVLVESFEKGQSIATLVDATSSSSESASLSAEDSLSRSSGDKNEEDEVDSWPSGPSLAKLKSAIAKRGLNVFLEMLFLDNFAHGDLHAGNILVRHHGRELIFLDAGIVVELGDREADCLVDLFACIVTGDGLGAGELMLARSRSSECTDKAAFVGAVAQLVDGFVGQEKGLKLSVVQVGALLGDVLQACRTHRVLLEARFAGTVAAVAVLEGLGRSLDPELDIIQAATPVVLKASAQRASKHVLGSKGSRDGSYAGGDDVSAHAILK